MASTNLSVASKSVNQTVANPLPKSVLVAEDEHLVAAGLCAHLAALGCTVVGPVADGRAALHAAETHTPDFALLDIRMPVMDGLEAAELLWKDFGIPSALITAYSDATYIGRAQQTGVFGYMLKPAAADALRASLSIAWARAVGMTDAKHRIEQLERLLANRRTIEQAKWKLVESRQMSEPDAHVYLQSEARTRRRRLIDVACELLGQPAPAPDSK